MGGNAFEDLEKLTPEEYHLIMNKIKEDITFYFQISTQYPLSVSCRIG